MQNSCNPKWLFFINTLPVAVLFALFFGQFNVIRTLLDENTAQYWVYFGLALGILGFLNFAYAVYLTYKKQNVSVFYGIAALPCYIIFIYLYFFNLDKIFPFDTPQWMILSNIHLYAITFLMPTLAYSVFIIAVHFTAAGKEHKAWVNFLIAISIPVAGYLFTKIVIPIWRLPFSNRFSIHISTVLVITATLVFFFFLVRGILIIVSKKTAVWQKYQLAWKIPAALILPILGLLANGRLFMKSFQEDYGIFGNFNNHWFYILAVLNGILICLPNLDRKIYRLFLFIGRSVTLSYSLYFFLVFLPFMPLSVVFIIAAGAGFLMLTPILLFIVHVTEMTKDFQYLKIWLSKKIIATVAALCFLTIPVCVTASFLSDKSVLNKTLDYLYAPDYSKQYNIDKKSLRKTLDVVKYHKSSREFSFLFGSNIPYLSSYFNWLVLNNLTLSDAKIGYAERVFFGETSFKPRPEDIQNANVEITGISTNSVFDKSQDAWKSWVDLEITNKNNTSLWEYATAFDLPEGCWISDYYLYVEGIKEAGILAEKKSAMWVYSNIIAVNRDPGILFYLTGNRVSFRIFPFSGNETRKTGIEFLHREPVKLTIGGNIIELGNDEEAISEIIETENFIYIPAAQKQFLKPVFGKSYLHILVDVSQNKDAFVAGFSKRINEYLDGVEFLPENARISFVNSYVNTYPLYENWEQIYDSQIFEGGFFLERAIQAALFSAYKNKVNPRIVVVTDDIKNAVLDSNFSNFKFAFPEGSEFYTLGDNGTFQAHSLIDNPKEKLPYDPLHAFARPVLEYRLSDNSIVYLADNDEPGIILKKGIFEIDAADIKEKNWQSALTMQAKRMSQVLHPETSGKDWLSMVKYSFISKVMTPVTSYLVVENEAQKAALRNKQELVLSGGRLLDTDDDSQSMSEPGLWIMAALFGAALWYRKHKKKKISF